MPIENVAIGVMALTLMVVAELLVVLEFRGLSVSEYCTVQVKAHGQVSNSAIIRFGP